VVHAAAALPPAAPAEIFSTAVQGTSLPLQAARGQGVRRFIFISSTAVYGIPDHHPLLESAAGSSSVRKPSILRARIEARDDLEPARHRARRADGVAREEERHGQHLANAHFRAMRRGA